MYNRDSLPMLLPPPPLVLVMLPGEQDGMDPAVLLLLLLLLLALVSVLGEDTLCPAVLVVLEMLLLLCAAGVCRTLMRESWKAVLGQRLALPKRCVRRSTAVLPNFDDR
jgi:hypothetical protein